MILGMFPTLIRKFLSACLVTAFVTGLLPAAAFRVGLDTYHNDETPEHYTWTATNNGGFSEFASLLEALGAQLTTVDSAFTSQNLANLDVVIIVDPDTVAENPTPATISAAEITALKAWVSSGGVLFMMGNNAGNAEFTNFNLLADEFGFTFNENTAAGGPTYSSLPNNSYCYNVDSIHIVGMSTLNLDDPCTAILTVGSEHLMAVTEYGAGKVFAIGDPWAYNEYLDTVGNRTAVKNVCGQLFAGHDGVPALRVTDFNQNPEEYWYFHVFNPESPDFQPMINSPAPYINVADVHTANPGSNTAGIQEAIDMLPPEGGTLYLPSSHGEYVITEPFHEAKDIYPFGGSILILRRGNIHFVSDGAVIRDPCTFMGISGMAFRDGMGFVDESRAADFYFKNITFDGDSSAPFGAVTLRQVDDLIFDNCTFRNYYRIPDPNNHETETGRSLISGNTMSDNLWWRDCHFVGEALNALFIDGTHGSGVISSRCEGDFTSSFAFPTNDDVTRDLDNDDQPDENEIRSSRYVVVYDCDFAGTGGTTVGFGGQDCLVKNNRLEGQDNWFVGNANRCHLNGTFGEDWFYSLYNMHIVGNTLADVDYVYYMSVIGPLEFPPGSGIFRPEARMGQYEIRCNRVEDDTDFVDWTGTNRPDRIDGPNVIQGNCLADPCCVTRGCDFVPFAAVDLNGDFVVDGDDLEMFLGEWLWTGMGLQADFNIDQIVNLLDFSTFTAGWTGPDLTPPTVPTMLTADEITHDSVSLSWIASTDNVMLDGYNVYRDPCALFLAMTENTFYTDMDVDPCTSYTYTVTAVDTEGNESAPGNAVAVTTLMPPAPSNLITNPSFEDGTSGWSGITASPGGTGIGELDTTVAHTGTASWKAIGDPANDFAYIRQIWENEDTLPSGDYRISGWIKTDSATGGNASLRLVQLAPNVLVWGTSSLNGTEDWSKVENTSITLPGDHEKARFDVLWDFDSGSAWYDDMEFIPTP